MGVKTLRLELRCYWVQISWHFTSTQEVKCTLVGKECIGSSQADTAKIGTRTLYSTVHCKLSFGNKNSS